MSHVIAPDKQLYELGEDWSGKNGLGEGTVIVLDRDGADDRWSEDGTDTPDDATNRMKVEISVNTYDMDGQWEYYVSINVFVSDDDSWTNALWIEAEEWGAEEEPHYEFPDVFAGNVPIMMIDGWEGHQSGFLENESPAPYDEAVFTRKEEAPADEPPGQVQNLEADSPAWDRVALVWDEYWSAETYDLERRLAGESEWTSAATGITGLTFNDEDRQPGTQYEYRVRGENEHGEGPWSEPISVQTMGRIAGTVLMPDGDTPAEAASVKVEADGAIVASGETDEAGVFDFSVDPGIVAHVVVAHEDEQGQYQALSFPFVEVAGTANDT